MNDSPNTGAGQDNRLAIISPDNGTPRCFTYNVQALYGSAYGGPPLFSTADCPVPHQANGRWITVVSFLFRTTVMRGSLWRSTQNRSPGVAPVDFCRCLAASVIGRRLVSALPAAGDNSLAPLLYPVQCVSRGDSALQNTFPSQALSTWTL